MCSVLLQLVTLWNILGKVYSRVIIDMVKWRRLKRSLQAPLINLSIIFISPCIFLTDGRSRGQTLLELQASQHSPASQRWKELRAIFTVTAGYQVGTDPGPILSVMWFLLQILQVLQRLLICYFSRKPSWNGVLLL